MSIQYNKTNNGDIRSEVGVAEKGIVFEDDSLPTVVRQGMVLAVEENDGSAASNKPSKFRHTLIYKEIEFDDVDL